MSQKLKAAEANKSQNLIGISQWTAEFERVDIFFEVTALSSYLVQPRLGHLKQAYIIFSYLKSHVNAWLVMDPTYIHISEDGFKVAEWKDFYPDTKDKIPPDIPEPKEKPVHMACFVDVDHTGNKITRRSCTGMIITLNDMPIL